MIRKLQGEGGEKTLQKAVADGTIQGHGIFPGMHALPLTHKLKRGKAKNTEHLVVLSSVGSMFASCLGIHRSNHRTGSAACFDPNATSKTSHAAIAASEVSLHLFFLFFVSRYL
jgi:hypothetical protein